MSLVKSNFAGKVLLPLKNLCFKVIHLWGKRVFVCTVNRHLGRETINCSTVFALQSKVCFWSTHVRFWSTHVRFWSTHVRFWSTHVRFWSTVEFWVDQKRTWVDQKRTWVDQKQTFDCRAKTVDQLMFPQLALMLESLKKVLMPCVCPTTPNHLFAAYFYCFK